MHPALHLDELRTLIARSDGLRQRDLFSLALVSQDWRNVAEPVLWEDLPNIVYLLKLMPRDCWIAVSVNFTHEVAHCLELMLMLTDEKLESHYCLRFREHTFSHRSFA